MIETPAAILASGETYECEPAELDAINHNAPKLRVRPVARRAARVDRGSNQLSLGELMGLVTFLCTMFAGFCWLSRGGFAGLAGTATVLSLRVVESDDSPLVLRLGWWMLLCTYLAAAAMAYWNL